MFKVCIARRRLHENRYGKTNREMTDRYENYVGPVHPGFYTPISADLQRSLREMERDKARDRVWVILSTSHTTLPPEAISELLQLTPMHFSRIGDTLYQDDNRHITADQTQWFLSSSGQVQSSSLEKHLEWMLDQLFGKLPALRLLQNDGSVFTLTAHMDLWSPVSVPHFDVSTLQKLAQLGFALEFVIRFEFDEDD